MMVAVADVLVLVAVLEDVMDVVCAYSACA